MSKTFPLFQKDENLPVSDIERGVSSFIIAGTFSLVSTLLKTLILIVTDKRHT